MENKVVDNREEQRIEREADIRFPDTGHNGESDEKQNQKNEWRRFGYIAGATKESERCKPLVEALENIKGYLPTGTLMYDIATKALQDYNKK